MARGPRCRLPHRSAKGSRKTGVSSYTKICFWQKDTPYVKKYTNLLYHNFIHKKNQGEYIYITYIIIKNRVFLTRYRRVGDDGVPVILQYRPSDLYLTDRKEKWKFCKKIPTLTQHLQIRPSLVHPFLPQDKLLIQMHLDVPCNAWASC